LHGETWILRNVDHIFLKLFFLMCWRKVEKVNWTNRVKKEILHKVKEDRHIIPKKKRKKVNWIGHILRRNCLLRHVVEEKVGEKKEMMGRRVIRRKQQLDELKEMRRCWKMNETVEDRSLRRPCFGNVYELVVRSTI